MQITLHISVGLQNSNACKKFIEKTLSKNQLCFRSKLFERKFIQSLDIFIFVWKAKSLIAFLKPYDMIVISSTFMVTKYRSVRFE